MQATLEVLGTIEDLYFAHKVIAIRDGDDIVFVVGSKRQEYHDQVYDEYCRLHNRGESNRKVLGGANFYAATIKDKKRYVYGESGRYGSLSEENAERLIQLLAERFPGCEIVDEIVKK